MSIKASTVAAALLLATPAAFAQDLDTSQMSQHADTIRQGILVDKTVRRGQTYSGGNSYEAKRARAQATCANRGRAAALHGADNPGVQKLYSLCEQLGF